jgi:hypothetical protein
MGDRMDFLGPSDWVGEIGVKTGVK